MKRLLKSWVFWAFAAPGLLLAAALLLHVDSRSQNCHCGSRRETWSLFGGVGTRTAPLFSTASERPSEFYREIIPDRHVHSWWTINSSFISLSGPGRISCGWATRVRPVATVYEGSPEFRRWLKEKIARGEIDAAAVDREFAREEGGRFFGWTPP